MNYFLGIKVSVPYKTIGSKIKESLNADFLISSLVIILPSLNKYFLVTQPILIVSNALAIPCVTDAITGFIKGIWPKALLTLLGKMSSIEIDSRPSAIKAVEKH